MKEYGWFHWNDLSDMLRVIDGHDSDRKKRLFGCGCARHIWPLVDDLKLRSAVGVAERFADWQANREQLRAAGREARTALDALRPPEEPVVQPIQGLHADDRDLWHLQHLASRAGWRTQVACVVAAVCVPSYPKGGLLAEVPWWTITALTRAEGGSPKAEAVAICELLRDIFGNPFRPVAFDPAWQNSTAVGLAASMYESRDFSAMPILADALEDAGCDHPDILAHGRGSGPHVRGCWVVDLVLGKS